MIFFKRLILTLLILGLGGGGAYYGYQTIQLKKVKLALEADIEQLNRIKTGLKTKYAQEKAKSASLHRAKLAVEGQYREESAKAKALHKKLKDHLEEADSSQADLIQKIEAKQAEINQLSSELSEKKEKLADIIPKYRTVTQKLDLNKLEIEELTKQKENLQADLDRDQHTLKRYGKHNTKLSELSQELLAKVAQEKGLASLVQREPITKLGQIELEKMIQDYLDRIDEEALSSQELESQ